MCQSMEPMPTTEGGRAQVRRQRYATERHTSSCACAAAAVWNNGTEPQELKADSELEDWRKVVVYRAEV